RQRVVWRRIVRQAFAPVGGDQARFFEQLDVGRLIERDDVRRQAICNGARGLRRPCVRLANDERFSGLRFPLRNKRRVDGVEQLAGNIVGSVEDLDRRGGDRGEYGKQADDQACFHSQGVVAI